MTADRAVRLVAMTDPFIERVKAKREALRKAKPDANTRTLRPDKCLVVIVIDPSLAPLTPPQHWGQCPHHQDHLRVPNP